MKCEKCRIGHYHLTAAPYLRWLDGQIMVVPDAPAYTCDICGNMVHDAEFVSKLQYMLDQFSGADPDSDTSMHQFMLDEFTRWEATRRSR